MRPRDLCPRPWIAHLLLEPTAAVLLFALGDSTFFVRTVSTYAAPGENPLDQLDAHLYVRGHHVMVPVHGMHFDGSANNPGSASARPPAPTHLLDDSCSYEALMTTGGEPASDDAVESFAGTETRRIRCPRVGSPGAPIRGPRAEVDG